MKLRNKETGKIIEVHCENCGVGSGGCELIYETDIPCEALRGNSAYFVASLTGYEVVEEVNMNKTLKDWTLGEVQEYCDEHECRFCKFFQNRDCLLNSSPNKWNLSKKPRLHLCWRKRRIIKM